MTQPAKHTPGPLHNVTGHRPGPWIRQVLNDESEAYIHDKHCNAIARVYSLSDAALIAAAPAMYEALTHALSVCEAEAELRGENDIDDYLGGAAGPVARMIRAALAQAEARA